MITRTLVTLMTAMMVLLVLELGVGFDLGLRKTVDRELSVLEDEFDLIH